MAEGPLGESGENGKSVSREQDVCVVSVAIKDA